MPRPRILCDRALLVDSLAFNLPLACAIIDAKAETSIALCLSAVKFRSRCGRIFSYHAPRRSKLKATKPRRIARLAASSAALERARLRAAERRDYSACGVEFFTECDATC